MSVYSLYYSPTGGTKKVMDILAKEWPFTEDLDISSSDKDFSVCRFARGDLCLIGTASSGGRVPHQAVRNLSGMKADHSPAVVVAVYGDRPYDDTLLELRKTAEDCGFSVIAALAIKAERSHDDADALIKPDEEDIEKIRGFVSQIKDKINKPSSWKDFYVPGRYPYRESAPVKSKTSLFGKLKRSSEENGEPELFI